MSLLSKGGQKNNIPKPINIRCRELVNGRGQRSSANGINSPEMVTSDYDSYFETDPESGGSASDGTRRTDDDADSGVIESATGTVATGTDLGVSVVFNYRAFYQMYRTLSCILCTRMCTLTTHPHRTVKRWWTYWTVRRTRPLQLKRRHECKLCWIV